MMNSERGFTLVELVIATAIMGILMSVLGTAVYQILTVTDYGNDKLAALHELQNAAHWFNFDGQQASAATGGSQLVLTLPDDSSITYALSGTNLQRTADGATMTLAQNIASAGFSVDDGTVTMSLCSAPAGRYSVSENGTYKVCLRPVEGG